MGDLIFIVILCFLVGGLILWATFRGGSRAPFVTIVLGLWFIALPICLIFKWYNAFAIIVTLPLGTLWTMMAVIGITRPLRYCIKGEGEYIQPVFSHTSRARHSSSRYYGLECKFHSNGKGYKRCSEDTYKLNHLNKKYIEGSRITIWINKKDPMKFLVKRFNGVIPYILLLVIGIGFLDIAVKIVFA